MQEDKITVSRKTIQDFSIQWGYYKNWDMYEDGYITKVLEDILLPLIRPEDLKDKVVAEIGSGNGRFINPLLELGVRHITSSEPSSGFDTLVNNIDAPERVTCLKISGDK